MACAEDLVSLRHQMLGHLMLIMTIGPQSDACRRLPDAMEPGIHGIRTHSIRGFMAFQLTRHTRTVMLMVPVRSESGFWDVPPGHGPLAKPHCRVTRILHVKFKIVAPAG
jgi:hypothetical protein